MAYFGRLSGGWKGKYLGVVSRVGGFERDEEQFDRDGDRRGDIDGGRGVSGMKMWGIFLLMIGVLFFSGGRYLGFAVVNEISGMSYSSLFGAIFLAGAVLVLFFKR